MALALHQRFRPAVVLPGVVLLAALPLFTRWIDEPFYLVLASRILLYALAATSLNLLVGFGGMVSFGHAAFFGAGAYVVAIAATEGITSAWLAWPLAVVVSACAAAVIGAISLRTRGVYFIMITLAFAQMMFYVFVSLKAYGGEDGLALPRRSSLGFGLDPKSDTTFYYVALVVAVVAATLLWRLVNSRFGRVLQGIRENETRMEAVGFPVYRYKLAAFVIAGAAAGLAGALAANQNDMASPSMLHWNQSGMFLVMVILGGTGTFLGPALGAAVMLLLEETLADHTLHAQFYVGAVLLAVVLLLPGGLATLLKRKPADD
jgi:branched-chain amino acid transport system permease protein